MNLKKIRHKNKREDLIRSKTKNCETLIKQTYRKAEGKLEFKKTKPTEKFHFNPPITIKGDWMLGSMRMEVKISIYNITEKNNKFKLCKFPDSKIGGASNEKVRDEIEKDLDISDITDTDFQDEIIGLIIIEEYREQVTKRSKLDKYMNTLAGYT